MSLTRRHVSRFTSLLRLTAALLPALSLIGLTHSLSAQTTPTPATSPALSRASLKAEFLAQLDANFAKWDRDKNGELSKGEIDRATIDPAVTGKAAAALVALKRSLSSKTYTVKPLTRDNIAEYLQNARANDRTQPDFIGLYAAASVKAARINRDLFASGTPKLEMLHQGRMGDCFALAPLGAMISRNPQEVVNLFHPQPDGTIQVTFGNGKPLVITPLTDSEILLSASARQDGVWVNVYEKAVGEHSLAAKAATRSSRKPVTPETTTAKSDKSDKAERSDKEEEVATALEAIAHGGSAGRVITVITGHRIQRFSCTPWHIAPKTDTPATTTTTPSNTTTTDKPAGEAVAKAPVKPKTPESEESKAEKLTKLRALLTESLHTTQKRLVCAGTPKTVSVPGISPTHAYAILDYDPDQDTLLIWNPHGNTFQPKGTPGLDNGYPTTAGKFTIPLKEAITFMAGFSFETTESAQ